MKTPFTRRHFTASIGLAASALALWPGRGRAVEPFARKKPARLLLSLAAYSFRDNLADTTRASSQAQKAGRQIDLFDFVDFCSEHGSAAELTSYYFPKNVDNAYLLKLRRHCFLRGVDISGTAVGNTFIVPQGEKRDEQIRYVKQWIEHAVVLGAPHIRVFAGNAPSGMNPKEAVKLCIAGLEECAEYAGKHGIFLGIENHGGIVAEAAPLLEIVRAVRSPWVGINLDGGNFHTDDPYADFASCAPYAVNVQLKAEVQRRGQKNERADLKRMVKALQDAAYQGYVALEYESKEDPWTAVPTLLREMQQLFQA